MIFFLSTMNLYLKKKFIHFGEYKVKCAIGKRGIVVRKKEGDKSTPKGKFKLKYIFFRKDRIKNLKSKLKCIPIRKNYGWCDDARSKHYNMFVKLPFPYNAERLYLSSNIYDIVVVIDYNLKPIKKNKGSAIFIHVAKKSYSPTLGCIAVAKSDLLKILTLIKKNTFIKIS